MRIVSAAAIIIAALGVHLVNASVVNHNFVHRSRHVSRHNAANLNQNVTERALKRRFDGARFTFYDAGLGACGKTNSGGDFIVALNSAQYDGGAHCFQTITISANGKTHSAQIVDECPGCPFGGLDFSRGLFDFFADESVGVLTGSWNFGGSAAPAPHPAPPPPPKTTHHDPPPPPPTHTTTHQDPPATTAPKPKPTTSPKPEPTTQTSPSNNSKSHSASSSAVHSSSAASASAQSSSGVAVPTGQPVSASPTAGNLAQLYANMVHMGSVIVAGNSASSNSA